MGRHNGARSDAGHSTGRLRPLYPEPAQMPQVAKQSPSLTRQVGNTNPTYRNVADAIGVLLWTIVCVVHVMRGRLQPRSSVLANADVQDEICTHTPTSPTQRSQSQQKTARRPPRSEGALQDFLQYAPDTMLMTAAHMPTHWYTRNHRSIFISRLPHISREHTDAVLRKGRRPAQTVPGGT